MAEKFEGGTPPQERKEGEKYKGKARVRRGMMDFEDIRFDHLYELYRIVSRYGDADITLDDGRKGRFQLNPGLFEIDGEKMSLPKFKPGEIEIARAIATYHGSTDEDLRDPGHQPDPARAHGHGVKSMMEREGVRNLSRSEWKDLEREGWKVFTEVSRTGGTDSRGRWHTSESEKITVQSPEGAILFIF